MARINAQYSVSVQQNGELQAQVERLQALLKMPPIEGFRYEHARVVERDFSSWWQRMILRKGSDYGIPSAPRWSTAAASSGACRRFTPTPASSS
jgi:rod shape-determining protein MreC